MGLNIKKALKERNLTTKEVAVRMGTTYQNLSQHINGVPTIKTLEKIAEAAGCDVVDFFERENGSSVGIGRCDSKNGTTDVVAIVSFACPHCGKQYTVEVKAK